MVEWTVTGSYLARRGHWQTFVKRCEADRADDAREWALSEIGGCHRVPRHQIRIEAIEQVGQ